MKKNIKLERALMLFILMIAGCVIYELPYLRYNYYDVLREALNLNNTQMGFLMTVYGIVAMLGYFPSGWLADRYSIRKLLAFSLIVTGLVGFYFGTYPSYKMLILIHVIWAITTSLTYWSAMIKAVSQLGDSKEQGRLYGIFEGGRGLLPIIYGFMILALFNKMGASQVALKTVINVYAIISVAGGIITLLFFKDSKNTEDSNPLLSDIVAVIKMPQVWLLAIIIFSSYVQYIAMGYITPYFTEIFKASVSLAAALGLIRIYALAVGAGPFAGFMADKIGSSTKVLFGAFIMIILSLVPFLIIPGDPKFIWLVIAAMVVLGTGVFITRGIYFAAIDEINVPIKYAGAAIGFASFIGFLPEAFVYTLVGNWLDKNPGISGYKIMFTFMIIVSVIGFVACGLLLKNIKKNKSKAQ